MKLHFTFLFPQIQFLPKTQIKTLCCWSWVWLVAVVTSMLPQWVWLPRSCWLSVEETQRLCIFIGHHVLRPSLSFWWVSFILVLVMLIAATCSHMVLWFVRDCVRSSHIFVGHREHWSCGVFVRYWSYCKVWPLIPFSLYFKFIDWLCFWFNCWLVLFLVWLSLIDA